MRSRVVSRNAALQSLGEEVNLGFVRFYNGSCPVDADTPLAGNTLIVECALSSPAFAAPSSGTMVGNPIGSGTIVADGSPTFARFYASDGVTAVVDMDVPTEITLVKSAWTVGEAFGGPNITWSQAAE